jgi:hypothetical protein
MPGLEGQGFFEVLGASRPELLSRLAFITGDTMSPKSRRFLQSTGRPFIEKPITPQEVRDLVYLVAGENDPDDSEKE